MSQQLPKEVFLDQGNDCVVMGLVARPDRPGKYNVLLTHSLFAKSEQHRHSPALRPLAIDSKSVYPRVVSCGVFANNESFFCVNEEELAAAAHRIRQRRRSRRRILHCC